MTKQKNKSGSRAVRRAHSNEKASVQATCPKQPSAATRDSLYDDMSIPIEKKQAQEAEANATGSQQILHGDADRLCEPA
jgi:hypothetical protein